MLRGCAQDWQPRFRSSHAALPSALLWPWDDRRCSCNRVRSELADDLLSPHRVSLEIRAIHTSRRRPGNHDSVPVVQERWKGHNEQGPKLKDGFEHLKSVVRDAPWLLLRDPDRAVTECCPTRSLATRRTDVPSSEVSPVRQRDQLHFARLRSFPRRDGGPRN